MHAFNTAAISLILNMFPSLPNAAPEATAHGEASTAYASAACPIPSWGGRCTRMDDAQRQRIRVVVATHAHLTDPTCQAIHALLLEMLDDGHSHLWTFELHQLDTRTSFVMGQAVRDLSGPLRGFGLRRETLRGKSRTLARAALHEVAHLAGEEEEGARRVERQCLA